MTLSFDARVGRDDGGKAKIERYRTELVMAGGVDAAKVGQFLFHFPLVLIKCQQKLRSSWGTAANLVLSPYCELLSYLGGGCVRL